MPRVPRHVLTLTNVRSILTHVQRTRVRVQMQTGHSHACVSRGIQVMAGFATISTSVHRRQTRVTGMPHVRIQMVTLRAVAIMVSKAMVIHVRIKMNVISLPHSAMLMPYVSI